MHVDRRVVGRSAGRHVDRPCGGSTFRHGLLEKSLNFLEILENVEILDIPPAGGHPFVKAPLFPFPIDSF